MRRHQYRLSVDNRILFRGDYTLDEIMSVFDERDRLEAVAEDSAHYFYSSSVRNLVDRLEVMGFSLAEVQRQVTRFARLAGDPFFVGGGDPVEERMRRAKMEAEEHLLRTSTFEEWRDAYIRLINKWN